MNERLPKSENIWVNKVASKPAIIGAAALAVISGVIVTKNNHFLGRLFNDHGDVHLGRNRIVKNELGLIQAYFKDMRLGNQAGIYFTNHNHLIEAKLDSLRYGHFRDKDLYMLKVDDPATKFSRAIAYIEEKYPNAKPEDEKILVRILIPDEYFIKPKIDLSDSMGSFNFADDRGNEFLYDIIKELSELMDIARNNPEEVLQRKLGVLKPNQSPSR